MAPEALYLNGECVARGQLGAECQKHEQCGAAEGMECHKNVCRCATGFKPETDETTNPMTNPSQKCVRSCESGSFTRDTTCLVKSALGGPCFVQAQCPENAGCYRGRCLCKCDHKKTSTNRCIKVEIPTTPQPPPGPCKFFTFVLPLNLKNFSTCCTWNWKCAGTRFFQYYWKHWKFIWSK